MEEKNTLMVLFYSVILFEITYVPDYIVLEENSLEMFVSLVNFF